MLYCFVSIFHAASILGGVLFGGICAADVSFRFLKTRIQNKCST